MKLAVTVMICFFSLSTMSFAQNWDNWRGPAGSGVAPAGDYPVKFSDTENVHWKIPLPGRGSSTPIIWGDRIFLTCGIGKGPEGQDGVMAFDWKGKELWRKSLGNQRPGKHKNGSGSNPSIVTDGQRLFAYFKSGTLAALDLNGKILWKTNLQKSFGEDSLWWDLGTSPVLAGPNVVVAVMHEANSYLVAYNQESGKQVWKVSRDYPVKEETGQSYTTPIVMEQGGTLALIVWGADRLTAHDAKDGSVIWTCAGFNPEDKKYWRVIGSPAVSDDVAVVPYGRGDFIAGVKLGGKGDVTKTHRLWEKTGIGADCPTPIAHNGKAYNLSDKGTLTALDIKTGAEAWSENLPKARGKFYSSPTLAGDKIYAAREEGDVYVVQVRPNFKVLASNRINDRIAAAPVLINDKVLLRTAGHLYCFGK